MPTPHAAEIVLSDDERAELEGWARRRTSAAGLALRAEIVLAAAEGGTNVELSERLGVDRSTVRKWRNRFAGFDATGWSTSRARAGRASSPTTRSRR